MSFVDYWEDYAAQVLHNLTDRSSFDTHVPVSFSKRGDQVKTHLLSSSMHFDSFGLPMAATVVFTPLFPLALPGAPVAAPPAGTPPTVSKSITTTRPGPGLFIEPAIEVQVGGDTQNPIVRAVPLSSLAQMWMV
jgi:hypothetical protein